MGKIRNRLAALLGVKGKGGSEKVTYSTESVSTAEENEVTQSAMLPVRRRPVSYPSYAESRSAPLSQKETSLPAPLAGGLSPPASPLSQTPTSQMQAASPVQESGTASITSNTGTSARSHGDGRSLNVDAPSFIEARAEVHSTAEAHIEAPTPSQVVELTPSTLGKLTTAQRDEILEDLLRRLENGSVESRAAAAESLFNTSSYDEQSRLRISAMGVVKPLVSLLEHEDVKGQMYAAYTLSALTSIEMSRADMRDCGAIAVLLKLVDTPGASLVSKKGAMRALGRLARIDDCAVDMVSGGALDVIVRLLTASLEDSTLLRRSLITLYFIGADKPGMQERIAEAGAVPVVLTLCESTSQEVQSEATDVVKVLSRSARCAQIIRKCGGIEMLQLVASQPEHSKSRTCATKALQRLSEVEEYKQEIIQTGGQAYLERPAGSTEAEQLAAVLANDGVDKEDQLAAIQAVADAVKDDPASTANMADAGVVEALVHLLKRSSLEGRAQAAIALARMAGDMDVRKRIYTADAVPLLVDGLTDMGPQGMEGAVMCLEKLVTLQAAAEQTVREPIVPGLLHVVDSGNMHAQHISMRTLFLLSGVDPALLEQLATTPRVRILALRAWHSKPDAQAVALLLLRDLSRLEAQAVMDAHTGALPLMVALESSPVEDVAKIACEGVQYLEATAKTYVQTERAVQTAMRPMLDSIAAASTSGTLLRTHERCLRCVPRAMYLSGAPEATCNSNQELSVLSGHHVEPPQVSLLLLQKLALLPGQRFLEIGCGSGYLTTMAAFVVGPSGAATGVDVSRDAIVYAKKQSAVMVESGRLGSGVTAPRFLQRDGGTLLELGETWHAIVVCGHVPPVWVKTLRKLLTRTGRLITCTENKLRLWEPDQKGPSVIGSYLFAPMVLSRRLKRIDGGPPVPARKQPSPGPRPVRPSMDQRHSNGNAQAASIGSAGTPEGGGLQPRMPSGGLVAGKGGGDREEDGEMAQVMREIEMEQMNGLLVTATDVEICHTPKGRKCRLGEGGFGVVYKALMNGVDEVAVKLVKAEKPSAKDMDLFLKEVRTLASLHHRNIVQFYGASLDPNSSMFFVTELMKGGDLYSALRHHPETLRWDKLGKKVALDVALGINYLHARRPPLLHRDLKSPNVLLSEEGVAKIADVGMVRSQVKDLVTAQPVMTPLWAAPEVMRHERASVKADIWSYGILIWELISGKDITEYQPLAISRQSGRSPRGKLMKLPVDCPPVVRRLFNECTRMEPDERPNAQDLVEWLRDS